MLKGGDGLYTMSLNSYARVSPLSSSKGMRIGPVFQIIPLFPFAVYNVTLEPMRGQMNRRVLFHTDVSAALSTTEVVPSESKNNGW